MRVDYNEIKKAIVRSTRQNGKGLLPFCIDLERLNFNLKDSNIIAIPNGLFSERVEGRDIPLISEYFKKEKLKWFNRSRQYLVLTFVPVDAIDEKLEAMIELLSKNTKEDDPDFDRTDVIADIIADYPCYNATVVGYQSNNPDRIGKNSYSIIIRANTNVILEPDYEYNNGDI